MQVGFLLRDALSDSDGKSNLRGPLILTDNKAKSTYNFDDNNTEKCDNGFFRNRSTNVWMYRYGIRSLISSPLVTLSLCSAVTDNDVVD